MAKPVVYRWPEKHDTAVAVSQGVVRDGEFILNGTLGVGPGYSEVSFGNISRTVSITAGAADMTGVTFTVTGIYNGQVASESGITGPAAHSSVETTTLYTTVTSVTVQGNPAVAVSIGSGETGHTNWFPHDLYVPYPSLAVSVKVTNTPNITYSFRSTLEDAIEEDEDEVFYSTGIVMPQPDDDQSYYKIFEDSQDSGFGVYTIPARYSCLAVTNAGDGSFVATFLQQGLTN